jgi:hypothetical protein
LLYVASDDANLADAKLAEPLRQCCSEKAGASGHEDRCVAQNVDSARAIDTRSLRERAEGSRTRVTEPGPPGIVA